MSRLEDESARKVVVIGSGFGGSVAAARIAEAGIPVVLLERGPWRDTVPTRSMRIERRVRFPRGWGLYTGLIRTINAPFLPGGRITTNRNGLLELFYSKGLEVVCSSSVGGGSHVYSAVHARPPDGHYWDNVAPGLSEESMKPHYEEFLRRMASTVVTAERRPSNHVAKRFQDSAIVELAKPRVEVRIGFLLPTTPGQPAKVRDSHGIERYEVDYESGDYGFLGSPTGAKTTLDFAYLAPAMKVGLEVRDLCEVISISRSNSEDGRYCVHFIDHHRGARRTIRTNNVIVAAGTMNTLQILLRSRVAGSMLDGLPYLGRRFSGNGDVRGLWDLNDKGSDLSIGLPSQGSIWLRDQVEAKQALSNNSLPSVDYYPLPRVFRERLKRSVVIAGMGEDAMDGVVDIQKGRLRIDFNPDNSPVYARIMSAFQALSARSGRKVYAFKRPSTVHPMGGACVGIGPHEAVVDGDGEVFGHPGLFVADAAALPRSIGGPPTATIAAWGGHVAARLVGRLTAGTSRL